MGTVLRSVHMKAAHLKDAHTKSVQYIMGGLLRIMGVLLVSTLPKLSYACSVCFDPNDEARVAFIITTAVLTLCPLFVLWGLFNWLKQKVADSEPLDLIDRSQTEKN